MQETNEKQEQKQIAIRMSKDEIKDLKQFCLNFDLTLTDAIKSGVALLKCCNESAYVKKDGDFYTLQLEINKLYELVGIEKEKIDNIFI